MAAAIISTVCVPLHSHLFLPSNACNLLRAKPALPQTLGLAPQGILLPQQVGTADAYLADWECLVFLGEARLTNQKVFFVKFLWIEAIITTIRAILQ